MCSHQAKKTNIEPHAACSNTSRSNSDLKQQKSNFFFQTKKRHLEKGSFNFTPHVEK